MTSCASSSWHHWSIANRQSRWHGHPTFMYCMFQSAQFLFFSTNCVEQNSISTEWQWH